MSNNETVSGQKSVTASSWKKKWLPVVEKVIVAVIGFLCAWLFNSVVQLRESVATLNESIQAVSARKQTDRDQWRSMSKLNDRIQRNEIETEVNRRVQQALLEIMILKNFGDELMPPAGGDDDDGGKPEKPKQNRRPPFRESKDLLDKLDRMQKPTDVDDYIQQEQKMVPPQENK